MEARLAMRWKQTLRVAALVLLAVVPSEALLSFGAAGSALSPEILGNIAYPSEWTQSGKAHLVNGTYSETAIPGSATQTKVKLTDTIAYGRVNGRDIAAVILVTDPGGSGTFYDLAVVRVVKGKPVNVAIARLGDRVKIAGVSIGKRGIEVELVRQGPADPVCCPSLHVRESYVLQGRKLVQTSPANPGAQSGTPDTPMKPSEIRRISSVDPGADIVGPIWKWERFQGSDDTTLVVSESDKYTLQLMAGGLFNIRADCNRGSGSYTLDGGHLTLKVQMMTRAACPPDSLSDRYIRDLHAVVTYVLQDDTLYLNLKMDSGNLVFVKTQ
jgi:heat shock protein HslJ